MYKHTTSGYALGRHHPQRATVHRKYRRAMAELTEANQAFRQVYREHTGMDFNQLVLGVLKTVPFIAAFMLALYYAG